MNETKRAIDLYPRLSFMRPAERASEGLSNEEAKNQFYLRLHLEPNYLNPELFSHGVSQEELVINYTT
jgi:hypothetical protein